MSHGCQISDFHSGPDKVSSFLRYDVKTGREAYSVKTTEAGSHETFLPSLYTSLYTNFCLEYFSL